MKTIVRLLILVAVFVLHTIGFFLIYRGNVVSHALIFESDALDLLLPTGIAFMLYYVALHSKAIGRSEFGLVTTLVISGVLAFLSMLSGMFFAFNTYGT